MFLFEIQRFHRWNELPFITISCEGRWCTSKSHYTKRGAMWSEDNRFKSRAVGVVDPNWHSGDRLISFLLKGNFPFLGNQEFSFSKVHTLRSSSSQLGNKDMKKNSADLLFYLSPWPLHSKAFKSLVVNTELRLPQYKWKYDRVCTDYQGTGKISFL